LKSREEDEAAPVSTPTELSKSGVRVSDGELSDIFKSAGTLISEVFDSIDIKLEHLKQQRAMTMDDDVQLKLPVE
jgi:hypothetical protein